jgi:CubicO group peptidase (beta-lactamase class C family)
MNSMSLASRSSMFLFVSIFSSVLAFANNGAPQPKLSDSEIAGIDRLFARWNRTNSPGFAVGVIRNGSLVFAKGYGMSNLEYGIPITPRSPFYIASMSKQFTAACAAVLVQQGRLRLDDDVRKYIPEMPDYRKRLTIDHLIHHTGGVREWSSLVLFAGRDLRYEDRLDNEDVFRLLRRQKSLEFDPGAEYRYSSGGYQLLTVIIERITGMSLNDFAQKNIFEPLGMKNTFFESNYAAILPGRVESYRPKADGTYERILKHFNLYGDGGVITNIEDLARWDEVFYKDQIGGKGFSDLLLTQGRLNSGETLRYAFGLEIYEYKGHKVIEHGGGMLGFTVDMARFPNDHLTVIALANTPERWSTAMAFEVADLLLRTPAPPQHAPPPPGGISCSEEKLRRLAGSYWDYRSNHFRRVTLRGGDLFLDAGEGNGSRLIALSSTSFALEDDPSLRVVFNLEGQAQRMSVGVPGTYTGFVGDAYDPSVPTSLDPLRQYSGDYYSEELSALYRFRIVNSQLTLQINDNAPMLLFPNPKAPILWNSKSMLWTGFGEIIFHRDALGRLKGLTIGDERVSAVLFTKLPSSESPIN